MREAQCANGRTIHAVSHAERPSRPGVCASRVTRALGALAMVLLAGCDSGPTPPPSSPVSATAQPEPTPTLPAPTTLPSPSAAGSIDFPLAVVTGLTNLKANISVADLSKLAASGNLAMPCGITVVEPGLDTSAACRPADRIAAAIEADQKLVALLPPGLVEPATKVLAITGDGPYGLFGSDLFGDPAARALPYPVHGRASGEAALDPAWTAYDATQVWTLNETGSLCSDHVAARQAVTDGKGWDWVFDGGTAKYKGPPFPNPNPPPGIDRRPIVKPVETGNDGVTSKLIRGADITLGNSKCPILPTKDWTPNNFAEVLSFAVPEDVVSRWEDFLGVDALYLPADHESDRGVRGIRSTLRILKAHAIPHTGLGMDFEEAIEPAYLDVAGLKVAFVSWNEVPGPAIAGVDKPGVAWLTEENVNESLKRARAGGADLVVCDPQWWGGGNEYKPYLRPSQITQIGWMDAAGCDQIFAGGLHVAGGTFLRMHANGVSAVNAGPGNFEFGQGFRQDTQEGIILEASFRGTTLVNLRLHPFVMVLAARAALTDPEGDGHYVLQRIWENSELDYTP